MKLLLKFLQLISWVGKCANFEPLLNLLTNDDLNSENFESKLPTTNLIRVLLITISTCIDYTKRGQGSGGNPSSLNKATE